MAIDISIRVTSVKTAMKILFGKVNWFQHSTALLSITVQNHIIPVKNDHHSALKFRQGAVK